MNEKQFNEQTNDLGNLFKGEKMLGTMFEAEENLCPRCGSEEKYENDVRVRTGVGIVEKTYCYTCVECAYRWEVIKTFEGGK